MNKKLIKVSNALSLTEFKHIFKVMKLTSLFGVLCVSSAFAVNVNSQSLRVNIHANQKQAKEVIKQIEEQTDYLFVYNHDKVNLNNTVTIQANNETVAEVLNQMFAGTDIIYAMQGNNILLMQKDAVVQQSGKVVTGTIVDPSGMPVIGANVMVKGTTNGTITDMDGKFSLEVEEGATLQISYIGYANQEIKVGNQKTLSIALKEDAEALDELVVVGYGVQKKESLTSAITSVDTEKLENRSLTKAATALQGITPGVNIRQTTGRPGFSASTFDIRGASMGTFSSNPPLVLIDGMVDEIDNVSPEDIENISILKDAAAAAIYGSRATGGVVLITTKKGQSGKAQVSYSGNIGFQKLPMNRLNFINTAEWMRANNEAARLDGSADIYSAEEIAKYENSTDPLYPAKSQWTDWYNTTALQQTHSISLRTGTDKLKFYASGNFVSQDGFIDNDDYKKVNFLMNVDYRPIDRLEINTSVSFQRENIKRPIDNVFNVMRNALLNPPIDPFYLSNGEYNNNATLGPNPAYIIKEGGNSLYEFNRLRMAITARYRLLDGLYIKYSGSTSVNYDVNNSFYKKIPFIDEKGNIFGYNRQDVRVSEDWARANYYNNLVMLDYTKNIHDNHDIYVMAGFQSEENRTDNIGASANKFPTNEIREISGTSGSGSDIVGTSKATEWSIASFIGKANYTFKNKYIFEGTIRYDGSSRFSPNRKWGLFPSASASWRIQQENFMQAIDWLSNLKLRLSWGQLGNQGSELYPFAIQISTSNQYPFGNGLSSIAQIGSPVDLNLSWEKKTTTNIGLDYGFFNNKLSGSIDVFFDRTNGIIGRPVVPSTFGAEAPIQNCYTIDNKGYEIELKWNDQIGDFKYFISANFFDNRDKIVSLGGIGSYDPAFGDGLVQKGGSTYNAEGKPRNSLYLYRTNGLFVDQKEIDNHAFISNLTRPGDIAFIDTNQDGKVTPEDKVADNRTTTPHYFYGFSFGGSYKNFDFMAVFNGVGQRWDYRNNGGTYLTGVRATLSILEENYNNRWTEENPDKFADQTRLTQNNWIANEYSTITAGPCEYHLRNFGYLRLKNLQVGYTIPSTWLESLRISKLRCYLTAENLLTIAPGYKEPIDPESVADYTDDGSAFFGVPRVVSFGVQVNF